MGQKWVQLAIFRPEYTIPIRARAYNDCVKLPVLLKTRSSGGPGYPLIERVLGLQIVTDTHADTYCPRISLHSGNVRIYVIVYLPKRGRNVSVWGGVQMTRGSGLRILEAGEMCWIWLGSAQLGMVGVSVHTCNV